MPKSFCGDISTAGTNGIEKEVFSVSSLIRIVRFVSVPYKSLKHPELSRDALTEATKAHLMVQLCFLCAGGSPQREFVQLGTEQCLQAVLLHCSNTWALGDWKQLETINIESMKVGSEFETLESYIA